jgi:2-oxoacid:acceptor oxidoreductase delta subunit (pyruvate/2-ketoisovalerate family)
MPPLKAWQGLEPGGTVVPADAVQPHTGGWRTGVKPAVDLSKCVDCLLCWLHCPDSAVRLRGTAFDGFDLDYCKGCEICAEVCPVDAITMVPEESTR